MLTNLLPPWLYPSLLASHQIAVTLSIMLFVARGLGVQLAATWPMRRAIRRLSIQIDIVLLTAGVSLWILMQYNPVVHSWLGVKLLLLVLYIVLGSFALKLASTQTSRAVFFVGAIVCVFWMVGIALYRHPLGWLIHGS